MYYKCAVEKGFVDVATILCKAGADTNIQDHHSVGKNTPLHIASQQNKLEMCQILLQHGANPNIQNKLGFSPLHLAAREGREDIIKLLLSRGADGGIRDNFGNNASYWAKEGGFAGCVSLLPPVIKISMKEYYEHFSDLWSKHDIDPTKGKKKSKKGKKKKK